MKKKFKNVVIFEEKGRRVVRGTGRNVPEKVRDIKEMLEDTVSKFGYRTAFMYKENGKIVEKTFAQFGRDVNNLGTALIDMDLKGEKIAVIGNNSYKWSVCYMAVLNGVVVIVQFDKSLSKVEIKNLIQRSGIKAIFYSKEYERTIKEISNEIDTIKYYINFDKDDHEDEKFLAYGLLLEEGSKLLDLGSIDYIDAVIDPNKLAALIFTSGTTKKSKGVMLTHRNLSSNLESLTGVIRFSTSDVHLSLLPIHHTFENTIGFLFMFHEGVCIAYCEGIRHLVDNLKEFEVTILLAVPAIYEAMYERIIAGIKKSGKERLVKIATTVSSILLKLGLDVRKLLLQEIRDSFAPDLRIMVSAAAPLDKKIIEFFSSLGIMFLQGYGLTETSPLIAVNTEDTLVPGTVGPPGYNIYVTIDNPDENGMGELLVRGSNVFMGYYQDDQEYDASFTHDNWFKTGDIAMLSESGLLTITGRKKSMMVFKNGKKAFPEEYEDILNKIKGVRESFVWGNKTKDGDIVICAKIVIHDDEDPNEMSKLISSAIKDINANLSKYKIIRYFVLTKKELVKTTTLKIKRNIESDNMDKYLEKKGCDIRKLSGSFLEE